MSTTITPVNRLRRLREDRGWSQARLAQLVGCDQTSVSNWERGRGFQQLRHRPRLRAALGEEVVDLLKPDTTTAAAPEDDSRYEPTSTRSATSTTTSKERAS